MQGKPNLPFKRALCSAGGLFLLCVFVPFVAAQSTSGHEIADPGGDVDYDEAYTGDQDHDYLDLLAAWVGYEESNDSVSFGFSGVDYAAFGRAPPADVLVQCFVNTTIYLRGEAIGTLWARLQNAYQADAFYRYVEIRPFAGLRDHIYLRNTSSLHVGTPGSVEFHVEREGLLNYADSLRGFYGRCEESVFPGGYPPAASIVGSAPIRNFDYTERIPIEFSLEELGPGSADENRSRGNPGNPPSNEMDAAQAPNIGSLAAVFVAAAAALLRGRRA